MINEGLCYNGLLAMINNSKNWIIEASKNEIGGYDIKHVEKEIVFHLDYNGNYGNNQSVSIEVCFEPQKVITHTGYLTDIKINIFELKKKLLAERSNRILERQLDTILN